MMQLRFNGTSLGSNLHGIILASGMGRRHRVLTQPYNRRARPKAMLPVGNRVLIDFSIEALKTLRLDKIHVGTGLSPLSETLERHITDRDAYQIDIMVHPEERLLDTAGTVKYIMENFLTDVKRKDTVCVLPSDTPHNIDLRPIYEAHLRNNAAATIAVLPIKWSSEEWKERTFGTIQMEGPMPAIKDYSDRYVFEDDVRLFVKEHQGEAFKVTGFHEKQERDAAPSNLVNTSIYFFNAGFLMDLAPFITARDSDRRFSDFGLHVFPLLGGRQEEFQNCRFDNDFMKKVRDEEYPFYAYLLPVDTYWRDVVNPLALLRANMEVLEARLNTHLQGSRFWHRVGWGWKGNYCCETHPNANIVAPMPGTIGSIISSNVGIEKTAGISNSVILDHTTVAGEVVNSICFPGTLGERSFIGRGVKIINSIYVGPPLHYHDTFRRIEDHIVFPLEGGVGRVTLK